MRVLAITLVIFGIAAVAVGLPTVAVVDFDAQQYGGQVLGAQLADYVTDELVNTGLFDVVEREKLRTIMREQGFSGSGMVSPNSAVQMGQLLGSGYVLTGRVISLNKERRSFDGYGVSSEMIVCTLVVSIRMFDTEKGVIVFSGRETASRAIRSAGGLRIEESDAFFPLIEDVSRDLITKLADSPRFSPTETKPLREVQLVAVEFHSDPHDADVEVDNVFYGNAGAVIDVPSGLHLIRISLAGHEPWEKKVMLRGGMKIKAVLVMKKDE
jgi:hypothetical protein